MASKKSLLAAAACAVVLIVGALWWLRAPASKQPTDSAAKSAGVLVTLAVAGKEDIPVNVVVNGNVVSLNSVDVKPQVSNVVEKVHVKEGDVVHAGQPLFTLDSRGDVANLQKARAQQAKDQAQLADLGRQYKRSQELLAQNFIAKSATETVLSQFDAQRAAVEADRAAVQAA
jgi:membrane fusion protein, multidrug efflux system